MRNLNRKPSPDELTGAQKQEYNRWQGYANALLLALTVLFAGTAIALPKVLQPLLILSLAVGLAGIFSTVIWFALESKWMWGGKPGLLRLASVFFGLQVGFLFVVLFVSAITTK